MTIVLKVGDTVWRFDSNRRVYRKPEPGKIWGSGGPIWREHWVPWEVIGETRVSWLVGPKYKPWKVPKRGADLRTWAFSEEQIDQMSWVEENKHRLADRVRQCDDYRALKLIETALSAAATVRV